jgi:hypothetical protein
MSSPSTPINPNASKPKRIRRGRQVLPAAKVPARRGSLATSEKSAITNIIERSQMVPAQIEALAIVMGREPSTIARAVQDAKDRLAESAGEYLDAHKQSVSKALSSNDPKALETARKGAEWALERISAKDSAGKDIRIIDSAVPGSSAPVIKIGIALGGLPTNAKRHDDE